MRPGDFDGTRGSRGVLIALMIASLLITTVYFREGDSGPIHRMREVTLAVSAPVARAGEWVTAPFERAASFIADIGDARREVVELRGQNAELRARLAELEEARLENERLRELVGFVEDSGLDYVGVRVIGRPTNSWEGVLTIDKGAEDGVEEGMPVIAAEGLIGRAIDASSGSSRVRVITDQRSGVSAIVQSSRVTGIVEGSLDGRMTMDFVPADQAPVEGDVILTSGIGGVYPKGIVIGDVVEVRDERSSLFPTIVVESRVPFSDVEEALVITEAPAAPEPGVE